mmetsp:Transcript_2905/g.4251  ORF Transcript_2905/g.4251 Transcript_2905/m.4251 type:complete len:887 (-) Transcript_2905:197-2857(-)|eukprot:CAMPEP_0167764662 /NCGR_PEP_ID=MMETSP0110_2-20121227/14186_1 /TAXON_ID=629695 /ORGANISM="Gymnochlora sp., Strain CCMP2014" /LENGTH=886 /DNA_ID=CAMNT_0007652149 /DNA_START=89 /DNA_END=2749 /DNA_ORIENTATION=+
MSATKWVYYFGEGDKSQKALLGGKGANLSEMTNLGLPVPPGFTITTTACIAFQKEGKWPAGLPEQVENNITMLEAQLDKKLGASKDPILLSVRSGAVISMPGMMDTVLNLGLNPSNVKSIGKAANNMRWAYDSFRRFIQMFADVCLDLPRSEFEKVLDMVKEQKGVKLDTDLDEAAMEQVCAEFLNLFKKLAGTEFPSDAREQLRIAINAVFKSWNNPRAIKYRAMNYIPDDLGTAVNVQAMVFGNMGEDCATGVGFTRDPSTGENVRYGEYLMNAQGEDVVAGIRTPLNINDMKTRLPTIYKELMGIFDLLENHYKDMQDIEFTIQNYKLWLLQTRNGKRTANAAVRMATEMVQEGLIDRKTAVLRVSPDQIEKLLHDQLDPKALKVANAIAKGLPASPGAAVGQVVFNSEDAAKWKAAGKKCILVRLETSPEDIGGMEAAEGVLTARGGMTSHAAVVARGMNKCCIAGCSALNIKHHATSAKLAGKPIKEGDWMSIDGSSGKVYLGKLPVVKPDVGGSVGTLLEYADSFRKLGILANADTPKDAKVARGLGAEGIGLTRTEHMFFEKERIQKVREMILAFDKAGRERALAKLLPFQRSDFHGILGAMNGLPVVIRLLDPPLHEFLPHTAGEIKSLAYSLGRDLKEVEAKVESLKEFNPMLGFRGCRLGVVYPEISAMQIRAIFQAAVALSRAGKNPYPHIEIPLVGNLKEYLPLKKLVLKIAKETGAEGLVKYKVGTMIEIPRAALNADNLAKECDFMSFGTNDLTQMTCGFSRDDAGSFLKHYTSKKIYVRDPFQSIDQQGVGKLMKVCVGLARAVNSHIDIGVCGEHGGDPTSVEFCHRIGLDNVSCSPYRVPVARMAAAHAALKYGTTVTESAALTVRSKL